MKQLNLEEMISLLSGIEGGQINPEELVTIEDIGASMGMLSVIIKQLSGEILSDDEITLLAVIIDAVDPDSLSAIKQLEAEIEELKGEVDSLNCHIGEMNEH